MKDDKNLSLKEIRKISIDILDDVDDYCKKNSITYFLACGTLLGAIKYDGFIPWDDDIDIMMPRFDFIKFINNYESKKYKVLKPSDGMYFYGKVYDISTIEYEGGIDYKKYKPIGVNIDVFPLDGIVNDEKVIKKQKKKSDFLEMLLRLSNQPIFYRNNPLKAINRIIPRIIGSKNIVKLIEKNAQKYKFEESNYVIRYKDTPNGFTGAISKEKYNVNNHLFENKYYNIPSGYNDWLSNFYGENYMIEEPTDEKRIIHNRVAYKMR